MNCAVYINARSGIAISDDVTHSHGVKITGEYVVADGAVATKDITENKIVVAGVPATIIKHYE